MLLILTRDAGRGHAEIRSRIDAADGAGKSSGRGPTNGLRSIRRRRRVVPVWQWTGCYGGGHAGSLRVPQKEWINWTPGGAFYGELLGGHTANSWFGGVQAGCDYQFAGGWAIGIQGDYAWPDVEGHHDSAHQFGVAYHSHVKSLATVTGRLGYAWGRVLGYIKGGGAGARQLLGIDDHPRDRLHGECDADRMDRWCRR